MTLIKIGINNHAYVQVRVYMYVCSENAVLYARFHLLPVLQQHCKTAARKKRQKERRK